MLCSYILSVYSTRMLGSIGSQTARVPNKVELAVSIGT